MIEINITEFDLELARLKGCFLNLTVKIDDVDCVFDFLTVTRLLQQIDDDMSTNGFSLGDDQTVVIEEISRDHITRAINAIFTSGHLGQFRLGSYKARAIQAMDSGKRGHDIVQIRVQIRNSVTNSQIRKFGNSVTVHSIISNGVEADGG